ncbi:nuclear transport factor 2 family protein [Pedobacter sp. SYP-B3415]|uniref:nuclear transport factor 2 family protein n=1 Tax=Pedobacter sp. SYP-B3415 TaxID=2496641 RepID=UPI00197CC6AC|nr:nuclear transport factor 2 family protein [Pedobacter sp. SYP-B3415]
MIRILTFLIVLLLSGASLNAQTVASEEEAVKGSIRRLFSGMFQADSSLAASAFDRACIMQTIKTANGQTSVQTGSVNSFLSMIAGAPRQRYDERIVFTYIHVDGPLASVWTDYQFYNGGVFSHCGVNSFQLAKKGAEWKIVYLIDTRRKEPCKK